jgi:hypothetical protein
MLFGPNSIRKKNIRNAERHVRALGAEIEALQDLPDDVEPLESKFPRLTEVMQFGAGHESLAEAAEWLELEDAELEVEAVADAWDNERYRDMTSRLMPGSSSGRNGRKCLFAGERTWGDGPERDSAWGIFERANTLGILGILGLE